VTVVCDVGVVLGALVKISSGRVAVALCLSFLFCVGSRSDNVALHPLFMFTSQHTKTLNRGSGNGAERKENKRNGIC